MNKLKKAQILWYLIFGAFIGIMASWSWWWALLILPVWVVFEYHYQDRERQKEINRLLRGDMRGKR